MLDVELFPGKRWGLDVLTLTPELREAAKAFMVACPCNWDQVVISAGERPGWLRVGLCVHSNARNEDFAQEIHLSPEDRAKAGWQFNAVNLADRAFHVAIDGWASNGW